VQKYNYDNASVNYDISRDASSEVINKLIRLLNLNSDSVILDLGCGTGNYTIVLQQFAKSIIGIDLSLGMIRQARAKNPSLNYVCANISYLPFRSGIFDGAFSNQVIHHVQKKELYEVVYNDRGLISRYTFVCYFIVKYFYRKFLC